MAVFRTLKQVKVFDIIAQGSCVSGHGSSYELPSIIYHQSLIFESDTQCEILLNKALEDYEEKYRHNCWGTTSNKPKLTIYWKTLEEKIGE